MAAWTTQQPQIATEHDCQTKWNCGKPGERFRCYLCGVKFKPGDYWRFVVSPGPGAPNFMTCQTCDGPDAGAKVLAMLAEQKAIQERLWWLY